MLYIQVSEKKEGKNMVRTFRNERTGSETKLSMIYKDKDGGQWWAFNDLYKIPVQRMSMAMNITDLYSIGLTLKDIQTWCNQEKTLLRSNDPEKYEKLYSLILEKERIATFVSDPLKQQIALCTVYIISDEERIDIFDEQKAEEKLKLWKGFPEMISFFLTWHSNQMQHFLKSLDKISTTVLKLEDQARTMKAMEQLKQSNGLG